MGAVFVMAVGLIGALVSTAFGILSGFGFLQIVLSYLVGGTICSIASLAMLLIQHLVSERHMRRVADESEPRSDQIEAATNSYS